MSAIHQLTAGYTGRDAISNEALAIQRYLRAAGFESDIFAEKVHPRVIDELVAVERR